MTLDPQTYRKTLLEQAFADEKALQVRKRTHELYSLPYVDLPNWVLGCHRWRGDEKVLDIGSGPGTYTAETLNRLHAPAQYIAGDFSLGMLKALRRNLGNVAVSAGAMDVVALPFADNTFDVVLANHMLYHVPHLEPAVQEIKRVLKKPGGVLIASTSSEYTMPEFTTLMQRAVRLLRRNTPQDAADFAFKSEFSLEHGTLVLARSFPSVARFDIPNAFIFHEAQPVIDYIESCRPFYENLLPAGIAWADFMAIMGDQVRRLVEHFGELVVNKLTGVILATDGGGFAAEYQQMQQS